MIDTREDVLARLVELVATIPNINLADRNNSDIDENQLPAAVIFDGDEETDEATDTSARPSTKPVIVRMSPAIEIAAMSGTAGTDLSVMRRELIRSILFDTELNDNIVKTTKIGRQGNGAIRYLGCQTDPTWMRTLYGQMRVQFMFKYVLHPTDL
jgi:hypothetical protein